MIEVGGRKSQFRIIPETCVDKGVTVSLAILANDVPLPPPATLMAPQGAHRLGCSLPSRTALVVLDVFRYRREPSCTSPCRKGARSFQGRGSATGFGTSLGMDPSLGMGVPWLRHSMYLYKNLEDDWNCMFLLAVEVRK
jgi:hypothetical protein